MTNAGVVPKPNEGAGDAPSSVAFVILSHTINDFVLSRYRKLQGEIGRGYDVVLLLTKDLAALAQELNIDDFEIVLEEDIFLAEYGEKGRSGKIVPGNTDLVMMAFARRRPRYDRIWMIEYDVAFPSGAGVLAEIDAASHADLVLGRRWSTRKQVPDWPWWKSLKPSNNDEALVTLDTSRSGHFALSRYSRRLFDELEKAYRSGWAGHHEATVPTIARIREMPVEDINDIARRSLGRVLLTPASFGATGCSPRSPDLIYHPIKDEAAEAALLASLGLLT